MVDELAAVAVGGRRQVALGGSGHQVTEISGVGLGDVGLTGRHPSR
jgi:hypothetical protein